MKNAYLVLVCNDSIIPGSCEHTHAFQIFKNLNKKGDYFITVLVTNENCKSQIKDTFPSMGENVINLPKKPTYRHHEGIIGQSIDLAEYCGQINSEFSLYVVGNIPTAYHTLERKKFNLLKNAVSVEVFFTGLPNLIDCNLNFQEKATLRFHSTEIIKTRELTQTVDIDEKCSITVVIPHFNQALFLIEAIKGFERYFNEDWFEIIVIDDGSTSTQDLSLFKKIKEELEKPNVIFLMKDNEGVGKTRNMGANLAKGKVLLFFDSDNVPFPMFLDCIRNCKVQQWDKNILTFPNIYFETSIDQIFQRSSRCGYFPIGNVPHLAWCDNFLGDSTFAISKETFLKLGGFHLELNNTHQDWQILYKAINMGFGISVYPMPQYYYRVHDNSMSQYMRDSLGLQFLHQVFDNKYFDKNIEEFRYLLLDLALDLRQGRLSKLFEQGEKSALISGFYLLFPQGTLRNKILRIFLKKLFASKNIRINNT